MKLIYCGQFTDASGYGSAARGYLRAIDSVISENEDLQLKIHIVAFEGSNRLSGDNNRLIEKYAFTKKEEIDEFISDGDYAVIWHLPAPSLLVHLQRHPKIAPLTENIIRNAKRITNLAAWEFDKVPTEWLRVYRDYGFDSIIVPSSWNHKVFSEACPDMNCYMIPHVIEDKSKEPVRPKSMNPALLMDKFTVFTMSQWGHRKGFDILIKAFCSEFKNQKDVAMVLKTYGHYVGNVYPLEEKRQNEAIIQEIGNYKNSVVLEGYRNPTTPIYFIPSMLPFENISWLHEKSSLFALTTRGEGFGLTIAEALTHKRPVLVPDIGGHTDYIHPDAGYFVGGHWNPSYGDLLHTCDTHWYEPEIQNVRTSLRQAYNDWKEDPETLKKKGEIGHNYIKESGYDNESIGRKMINVMRGENDISISFPQPGIKKRVNDLKHKLSKVKTLEEKAKLLHNAFEGEECYVLSCGPSLKDHDPEFLRSIFKDKLVLAVKQAYDHVPDCVDFHFWNCANLPMPSINGAYYPYWQREPIAVCSSNYDLGKRWDATKQKHDLFFKIPIRTEIQNEFLTKTHKFEDFAIENSLTRPCGPGIMYETVIYTAAHLGVSKITALGWDLSRENPKDLKEAAAVSKDYPHFYEDSTKMFNKGDVLPWEVKITCEASEGLNEWLKSRGVQLELASDKSALSDNIPRVKL